MGGYIVKVYFTGQDGLDAVDSLSFQDLMEAETYASDIRDTPEMYPNASVIVEPRRKYHVWMRALKYKLPDSSKTLFLNADGDTLSTFLNSAKLYEVKDSGETDAIYPVSDLTAYVGTEEIRLEVDNILMREIVEQGRNEEHD